MAEETPQTTDESSAAQTGKGLEVVNKLKDLMSGGGGGKNQELIKVAVISVIVIIVMAALSFMMWGIAIWATMNSIGEPSGNGANAGACYLNDEAFRDVNTITVENLDSVMASLNRWHPDRNDIKIIIEESKKKSINPAVLISFFGGEQSFNHANAYKAFGCDCPPGEACPRHQENRGIDGQSRCALNVIEDAIQNTGSYTQPKGQNIWTRLLYNYVAGARKQSYDRLGYVSNSSESRVVILKAIVPNQVTCVSPGGGNLSPVDIKNLRSWYFNQSSDTSRGGGYWGSKHERCSSIWSSSQTFGGAGCGITSMAMIARYYGKNLDPYQMGGEFCSKASTMNVGPSTISAVARGTLGLRTVVINNPSLEDVRAAVQKGPLLARGEPLFGSSRGHFAVIAGVDGDKIILNDPTPRAVGKAGRVANWSERGNLKYVIYFQK